MFGALKASGSTVGSWSVATRILRCYDWAATFVILHLFASGISLSKLESVPGDLGFASQTFEECRGGTKFLEYEAELAFFMELSVLWFWA